MRYYYFARPDRLLLDLDGPRALARFKDAYAYLFDTHHFRGWTLYRSHQSGHYHVVVRLNDTYSPEHRSYLQALLGSDLKRERYHARRFVRNVPNPIILISFRKYRNLKVDFSCDCPRVWKGRRLRSCYHLRRDVQPGDRPI
jgi:hypothetical protein